MPCLTWVCVFCTTYQAWSSFISCVGAKHQVVKQKALCALLSEQAQKVQGMFYWNEWTSITSFRFWRVFAHALDRQGRGFTASGSVMSRLSAKILMYSAIGYRKSPGSRVSEGYWRAKVRPQHCADTWTGLPGATWDELGLHATI